MSEDRLLEVRPEHGWGWADNGEKHEWNYAPEPFHARVSRQTHRRYDKDCPALDGVVEQAGHELDGFNVSLSPRHEVWDGIVAMTLERDGRRLAGLGQMDMVSFDD